MWIPNCLPVIEVALKCSDCECFGATCVTRDAVGQNILEIIHEYSQLFAIFAVGYQL